MADASPVLLDTDAWSRLYTRKRTLDPRTAQWREVLFGRSVVIAVQTRGEVLAGAIADRWGEERLASMRQQLDGTATLPVDREVADTFGLLTAKLKATGYALHQKQHTGDRWVAATAVTHRLPLLAGDRIYRDVPELELLPWEDRELPA